MFQKFLCLPNHSIRVCVKRKRIKRGVGYGLEIPAKHIFYGNGKAIQLAKRTLDAAMGMWKNILRCLKQRNFEINQLFPTCVLSFMASSLLGVIFTGIIQTGLERFVR